MFHKTPFNFLPPPEAMVRCDEPFDMMALAEQAWRTEPSVREDARRFPAMAAYLFLTARGEYTFVILPTRSQADTYAAEYELRIAAFFNDDIWRVEPGVLL